MGTAAPEAFTHYLAAWNEQDLDRIRGHLDLAASEDVLFVDPANTTVGLDQLENMIRDARAKMPGATYDRVSGVDGHNRRYRYRWEVRIDGRVTVDGMDVTTVDTSGRIERIDGFFGDIPAADPAGR
ncbi:nuclear transport factor 2 family protein [Streptomyces pacificus]|uniref:Nuclear transport factor 2 family protein n=1 Tax=Streptomyces pacificus TaxID=2705029 RepID=A0A6A0B066_9ACTN|nr:nuclear transport factor 2 family protein [Streptomyces pacificus]GFH37277.1 nuclear transport factor 2 family protein [Streptomyces pacificus]